MSASWSETSWFEISDIQKSNSIQLLQSEAWSFSLSHTWTFTKPRPLDTLDTEVRVTYDPYELRGLVQIFSIAYYDVQNLVFYSHININQIT